MFHGLSRLLNTLVMAITHSADWKKPSIHAWALRPRTTNNTRSVSSDMSRRSTSSKLGHSGGSFLTQMLVNDHPEAIDGIESTVAGMSFAEYERSWQTRRAVERGIEIIHLRGEPPHPRRTERATPAYLLARDCGNRQSAAA